ncbi:MAG: FeoB-associated Cys-rich membrane protein [Clostridiales bacterium]|nr:FeoB-associated Cys-rich membrane protein [Clostridiales bacterium]
MATAIVLITLVAVLFLLARSLVRGRRSGGCGGGCAGCSGCCPHAGQTHP